MKKDMRSRLAKARDEFLVERFDILPGPVEGIYLRNRLELAFIAGWDAAIRSERKKSPRASGKGKEE